MKKILFLLQIITITFSYAALDSLKFSAGTGLFNVGNKYSQSLVVDAFMYKHLFIESSNLYNPLEVFHSKIKIGFDAETFRFAPLLSIIYSEYIGSPEYNLGIDLFVGWKNAYNIRMVFSKVFFDTGNVEKYYDIYAQFELGKKNLRLAGIVGHLPEEDSPISTYNKNIAPGRTYEIDYNTLLIGIRSNFYQNKIGLFYGACFYSSNLPIYGDAQQHIKKNDLGITYLEGGGETYSPSAASKTIRYSTVYNPVILEFERNISKIHTISYYTGLVFGGGDPIMLKIKYSVRIL